MYYTILSSDPLHAQWPHTWRRQFWSFKIYLLYHSPQTGSYSVPMWYDLIISENFKPRTRHDFEFILLPLSGPNFVVVFPYLVYMLYVVKHHLDESHLRWLGYWGCENGHGRLLPKSTLISTMPHSECYSSFWNTCVCFSFFQIKPLIYPLLLSFSQF